MAYKKLKGGVRNFASRSSYWLGEDHLLLVSKNYFFETYRRIYFADILGIAIRRTPRRAVTNTTFLVLCALMALLFLIPDMRDAWWLPAGLIVFFAIIGLALHCQGPGCDVTIRTAAGIADIKGLAYLPAAKKFFSKIEPLITNPQQAPDGTDVKA